ncbi:MAG TPA: hypothetical protein VFH87_02530, partial [Candidatus Udaeobacter sp.]|nr:hypothetical protein [Candidatus Udaeobacter sp.]
MGIAKDAADKAYYHTDEVASSAGMLISPFKLAGTDRVDHGGLEEQARFQGGKWVRELMEPNAIFPHFMNEVGHAASDFAYLKDIGFRNEINKIFEYVDQHIKDLQLTTGGRSEWTQNPLHSLTNPREFLAGIFNDGRLHKLLNSIDDPFAPLTGAVPARGRDTLFTRLKTAIQNVLVNVFGIGREPAGTLLNRMEELANRGFEIQQRMNLRHRGDIYQQAIQQQLLGGILRPIPKGEGETPLPTWTQGMVIPPYTPTPIEEITGAERIRAENAAIVTRTHISSVIKNHESLLADAQAQLAAGVPGAQEAVNRELTALRSLRHMMLTPRERYALSATEPAPLREERKFPQGVRPEAAPEQPDVWTVTPEGTVLKGPARAPAPRSEEGGTVLKSRETPTPEESAAWEDYGDMLHEERRNPGQHGQQKLEEARRKAQELTNQRFGQSNILKSRTVPEDETGIPKPVFNIQGRKGTMLRDPLVNNIVTTFAAGQNVKDAFSGSGQLSAFARNAGANNVSLNVFDPAMHGVFSEIKANPNGFGRRVANVVSQIDVRRNELPRMKDGSDIRAYLDAVQKRDPNVGLFLKQNLSYFGREVTKEGFTPAATITNKGLSELPNRIRQFSKAVDTVTQGDGWNVVANAQPGDRVIVDPPYVADRTRYGAGAITPEQRLAEYEKHLFPAVMNGANFLVFDLAEPRLMQSLANRGFTVQPIQRTARTGGVPKQEFVAYNHSGQILPSRVDGQAVLDSMKSAALYVHEDADRIWFRPYDGNYFRDTYGPAFGFNLRWEPRGE